MSLQAPGGCTRRETAPASNPGPGGKRVLPCGTAWTTRSSYSPEKPQMGKDTREKTLSHGQRFGELLCLHRCWL